MQFVREILLRFWRTRGGPVVNPSVAMMSPSAANGRNNEARTKTSSPPIIARHRRGPLRQNRSDVSIPFASVATFVVGLYSPFMSIWLASGLVVSVSALMFAGIVFLPRARRTRSTVPDSIVRYLFALVLTCGIVMMFVAMVIFGIGVFIWLRFGEYDRVAFAIQEGTPFLILTIVLWVASFGLLRVRLRGMVAGPRRIAGGDCARNLSVLLVCRIHTGECESGTVAFFESRRMANDGAGMDCSRTTDCGIPTIPAGSDGGLESGEGANL